MTVANSTMKWSAVGAGAVVAVPLTGSQVYDIDDLEVIVRTVADGSETTLTKTTDYAAAGIPGAAVTVTTVATYTSASEIHVRRLGDYTQTNKFVQADSFPDAVVEQIADEDTMTLQVLKDAVDRALKFAKTSDDANIEFPDLVASKYVQINGTATGFTLADSGTTSDARVNSLFNGAAADDIFATYVNLDDGALILDGAGSPEASQVAPVGSIYLRTDGGAGTSVYYKETGVDNTGWIARNNFTSLNHTHADAAGGGLASADSVIDQGGGANLKTKVIEIGDWNMNVSAAGSATKNVSHGLTLSKIRQVDIIIRDDADVAHQKLITGSSTGMYGWVDTISAATVNLKIATGGGFDSAGFDSTSFNRGWVTITYTV